MPSDDLSALQKDKSGIKFNALEAIESIHSKVLFNPSHCLGTGTFNAELEIALPICGESISWLPLSRRV